jgi:hypothetical protein
MKLLLFLIVALGCVYSVLLPAEELREEEMTFVGVIHEGWNGGKGVPPHISSITVSRAKNRIQDGSGLTGYKLEACESPQWYCIDGWIIAFHAPKEWNGETKSWKYGTATFSVVDRYGELGGSETMYLIERVIDPGVQEWVERARLYLYSPKSGLRGFTGVGSGSGDSPIPLHFHRSR